MLKKRYLFLILIVSLFAVSAVSAIDNETQSLTSTGNGEMVNNNEILSVNEGTYSELASEIGSGGNITLNKSLYIYDYGSTIYITQSGTIDGNGTVIDMNGAYRMKVFNIVTNDVTIKNIIFKNTYGMSFYDVSSNVVNCSFVDYSGYVRDDEGVIYYDGGSGNISDCNFINFIINPSSYYDNTAIIYNNNGFTNISNCNFINCSGDNYNSVVYVSGLGNISNCNFINCSSCMMGAAINGKYDKIYACNFVNCSSKQGGAIEVWESGNIFYCSFINCSADLGGAIEIQGYGNIYGSTFVNCSSHSGGAIYMYYGNVSNCRFIGNQAEWGSALSIFSGEIKNSIFLKNKANSTGITLTQSANIVNIVFTGLNNYINAIDSSKDVIFNNVTYWGFNGIMNTDTSNISYSNNEAGINISITVNSSGNVKKIMRSTDVNGNIALDLGKEYGDYTVSAYHPEDSYYTESGISNLSFSHNFDIIAPNITMYCGHNERFIATLLDKESNPLVNKNVTIILNGVEHNKASNDDGIVSLQINNLVNGIYDVIVLCDGYRVDSVVNIKPTIIYKDANYKYGDAIFLNATFLDSDGNPLSKKPVSFSVYVGNTHYVIDRYTDENGYLIINDNIFRGATPKNYRVSAYNSVTKDSGVFYINISKSPADISLNVNQNSGIVKLTAEVNPDPQGYMTFVVDDEEYTSYINNGVSELSILDLYPGKYVVNAIFKGNDNVYPSISNNVSFSVSNLNISAPDVTKYYGGSERFVVTLKESGKLISNANIKIMINGQSYTRTTDSDGRASIAINLNPEVYNVTIEYNGTKVYSTVTVKSTISANDFTKIFRNGTQYYGKFIDSQGNSLKDTQVRFNINGVFYDRTTNGYGVATLNINLNPGTYILTAINPSNGENRATIITVLPNIIENHDLIKYYKNDSQYVIKVLDDQGRPVSGENVDFNINGVFYTRTSNATGHVKMNINLNPGTYIITAIYKGLMVANTIKVLSILEAEDLNMKCRDGKKFEARLLDGNGNPFGSKVVTFNINGVLYERLTDAMGVARLNINLNPGDYIITSSYNGLDIANKIHISPNYDEMFYIDLPSYDDTTKAYKGKYYVEVTEWRVPPYCELDIMLFDSSGDMVSKFDYETFYYYDGQWNQITVNEWGSNYHKWRFDPDVRITKVAVKLKNALWD